MFVAAQHLFAIFLLVGQGARDPRQAQAARGNLHVFAVINAAFTQLLGKRTIHARKRGAQAHAQHQENHEIQCQHGNIMNVRKTIEAANCLTQGANAIREGEKRADSLIEASHHLNRIQARSGRNLHEHQNDAETFSYVLEQHGKRVNDA